MSTPPPELQPVSYAVRDPRTTDVDHLRALSVCHFVWGGLLALFACFPIVHIILGFMFMAGAVPMTPSPNAPPFDQRPLGVFFVIFGSCAVLGGWTLAGFTIASGVLLRRRRRRMWSVVIAGINCAVFPFGTVLGVFSLMVLMRDSVRRIYDEVAATGSAAAGH